MKDKWLTNRKICWLSGVMACLFALCMVCGQGLNKRGEIPVRSLASWVAFIALFFLGWNVFFPMLQRAENGKWFTLVCEKELEEKEQKRFLCGFSVRTALLFAVCYLPSLLAVYPGFFLYDAQDEYVEVATRMFTTHHPLLHVLALGGTICGVHKVTGSYNLGIFVYMLFQIAVVSVCFTYLLFWMKKHGVVRRYRVITFLYLAFFPVNSMFVLCSAKDTLFAAMLLLCVLHIVDLVCYKDTLSVKEARNTSFYLVIFAALSMMLRNNALYAFLVFGVLLVVFGSKEWKRYLIISLTAICLYLCGAKGLAVALNAPKSGHQEMLTVPIQQLARAYRADATQFDETDKKILFSYLPEETLARYTPKLSDPVKVHFDNVAYENCKGDFWKLWFKTFTRNPIGYVNAWFMTSYGYWYPDAEVDVYEGHTVFTHSYEHSSYFGFETEQPGVRQSKIPFLETFFEELSLEDTVQEIPIVSLLFSMGALFWIYLFGACILFAKNQERHLIAFAFPALVWLTLLLGPTYLPRYVVFLWFLLPLMVVEVLFSETKNIPDTER